MSSVSSNGQAKIRFLGGTRQVGRSGVALSSGGTQVLLDYGVLISQEEPGFPVHVSPKEVDGIIVTHAHLDHTGGVPIYHIRNKTPVYGTSLTFAITDILIKDFINLAGYYLPYEYLELDTMLRCKINVEYGSEVTIGSLKARFIDAGHIPGSMQIVMETAPGKTLVYTGDVNLAETKLLGSASLDYGQPSAFIVESTYANEDHPGRLELEKEFVARIREVVERGGTALVPAFSVGRSQEVLCVLAAHEFPYPIMVDGMALNVNETMLQHPRFFKDYKLLRRALEDAKWVSRWNERKSATRTPGVIVAPAGMLKGGAAAFYVQKVAGRKQNAIFLVSFQIPGTPGKVLLNERKIFVNGKAKSVEAEVERFDFSSHSGRGELETMMKSVKGSPDVYVMHGTPENCQNFAQWIHDELGLKAIAPQAGEVYKI